MRPRPDWCVRQAPRVLRPLRRAARRLRDRWRGASLVLLYHRVASLPADPWGLAVRPEQFSEQMAVLAARGDVGPLGDLIASPGGRRPRRRIAVTFDDGYADFRTAALPVLERTGVPVTLFVTTGGLGGQAEFWWDALARQLLDAPALPARLAIELAGVRHEWDTTAWERDALYRAVHALLGRADPGERAAVLARLAGPAGPVPAVRPAYRPLGAEDLVAVAASPLVTVGAHTVTHPYLGALPLAAQAREIVESRRRLVALTGAPVADFSYPHGDRSADTVRLVRAAGFRGACGTAAEAVGPGHDPFALPRVEPPDVGGDAFARWLAEWMGG